MHACMQGMVFLFTNQSSLPSALVLCVAILVKDFDFFLQILNISNGLLNVRSKLHDGIKTILNCLCGLLTSLITLIESNILLVLFIFAFAIIFHQSKDFLPSKSAHWLSKQPNKTRSSCWRSQTYAKKHWTVEPKHSKPWCNATNTCRLEQKMNIMSCKLRTKRHGSKKHMPTNMHCKTPNTQPRPPQTHTFSTQISNKTFDVQTQPAANGNCKPLKCETNTSLNGHNLRVVWTTFIHAHDRIAHQIANKMEKKLATMTAIFSKTRQHYRSLPGPTTTKFKLMDNDTSVPSLCMKTKKTNDNLNTSPKYDPINCTNPWFPCWRVEFHVWNQTSSASESSPAKLTQTPLPSASPLATNHCTAHLLFWNLCLHLCFNCKTHELQQNTQTKKLIPSVYSVVLVSSKIAQKICSWLTSNARTTRFFQLNGATAGGTATCGNVKTNPATASPEQLRTCNCNNIAVLGFRLFNYLLVVVQICISHASSGCHLKIPQCSLRSRHLPTKCKNRQHLFA